MITDHNYKNLSILKSLSYIWYLTVAILSERYFDFISLQAKCLALAGVTHVTALLCIRVQTMKESMSYIVSLFQNKATRIKLYFVITKNEEHKLTI